LAAYLLRELVARDDLDPATIDDVVFGCVSQVGAQACNVARHAALAAGWPEEVPGVTVDRQSASSAQAVHWAAQAVMSGAQEMVVAGGVEVMSTVPMGANLAVASVGKPYGQRLRHRYQDSGGLVPPALAADKVATLCALSRAQLDEWVLTSHERAQRAQQTERHHVLAVPAGRELLARDEAVVPSLSVDDVGSFTALFAEGGTATAANLAGEGDGAAGLLIASTRRAEALGLVPKARLVSFATAGSAPALWPLATIEASRRALHRCALSVSDIDHFEIHESSAAAVLAWLLALGAVPERVNPVGGSLARTAPQGAVGAGLFVEAVAGIAERGAGRALVSVAGEGGVATACVMESPT
jgi:acetyl-CoA acyltransferase